MNGHVIKLFFIAFIIFIISDMVWLGLIAKNVYIDQYATWLRLDHEKLKPLWWAALLVYFLLALSIVVFIVPLAQTSLLHAALYGALLGAIVYGVYDFTCLAIFKDFPIAMGFMDWAWGIVLCAWASFVTTFIARYL